MSSSKLSTKLNVDFPNMLKIIVYLIFFHLSLVFSQTTTFDQSICDEGPNCQTLYSTVSACAVAAAGSPLENCYCQQAVWNAIVGFVFDTLPAAIS